LADEVSVLVIEAGPILDGGQAEEQLLVPGFVAGGVLNSNTQLFWNYTTLPQEGLDNRPQNVPAGRVVGGGTAINGMFFDRGSKLDYNEWAEYTGDPGWGWDSLLKSFKKSETFHPPQAKHREELGIEYDPSAHGTTGPVHSSYADWIYPQEKIVLEANRALGVPIPKDHTNGNAIGAFWSPSSIDPRNMTRSYAKSAHHDRARNRPNYHLITNHQVLKIRFSGTTAVGVEVYLPTVPPYRRCRATKRNM
jgi:choline dehydrogenase-like flavoprotein